MSRKFVVTIEDHGDHTSTSMEGNGFSPFELIGYLEQVKSTLLKKAEQSRQPVDLADLLGKMSGNSSGFNIEDLLGGLPRGIKGPKDEDN